MTLATDLTRPVVIDYRDGMPFALVPMSLWKEIERIHAMIIQADGYDMLTVPVVEWRGIQKERRELIRLTREIAPIVPAAQAWLDAHPPDREPYAAICIEDGP